MYWIQRSRFAIFLCIILYMKSAAPAMAQTGGLAATRPMGWNSWNHFAGKIDDVTERAQAYAMVSSGMCDAGYIHIKIEEPREGRGARKEGINTNRKYP